MKNRALSVLLGIVVISILFTVTAFNRGLIPQTTKSRDTVIPKALRGTWYQYDNYSHQYDKFIITKHNFKWFPYGSKGLTIHGDQFHTSKTHADLYVKRLNNGYYKLGARDSDAVWYYKPLITTDFGKRVHSLKNMQIGYGDEKTIFVYAFHYKDF